MMKMKRIKVYALQDSDPRVVSAVNDGFGKSLACFPRIFRPGEVARGTVARFDNAALDVQTRFLIVKRVHAQEVYDLLALIGDTTPLAGGYWHEVIGE